MVDYVAMGRRIRARRRKLKLSQEQLAHLINVSPSFFGNIERGTRIPSIDTLVAIANALSIGVDYLLSDSMESNRIDYTREEARAICNFLRDHILELDYSATLTRIANNEGETPPLTAADTPPADEHASSADNEAPFPMPSTQSI
ncbi:MAG: helix-turn-helix domain-containing protein [Clostridiales bacterium]|nr:helix-turn-helix domain-containing protein [Clostridiales bacterium]